MGSYLHKPETTKKSAQDENDYLEIASSSMQGWRISQEDAHNAIPQLIDNTSFFAVYDGHGGSEVAEYCSIKLPEFLKQLESFKNGNYEEALKEAFMGFDHTLLSDAVVEELRQLAKDAEKAKEIIQEVSVPLNKVFEKYEENIEEDDEEELPKQEISGEEDEDGSDDAIMSSTGPAIASGCTAVVALLVGRDLYVANAGDSRCIVSRAGKVVEMSFDHKPEDAIELNRICKAGGRVTMDGRVNGGLNLSRAIGDHEYKMNKELLPEEQMITAMPDLKKITLTEEDEFMVLACDGIWNYMSNEKVVGFVKYRIDAGKLSLTQICEELLHNCLAPNNLGNGIGCDNMTAIIVKFKPALFKLPAEKDATNSEAECIAHKRADEDYGVADNEHTEKKQKLEDDLTPSRVNKISM